MRKIKELECTCFACPEQYTGTLESGEEVYIRLRWGTATIKVNDEVVFEKTYEGDEYKGCFDEGELKEFLNEAGFTYDFSNEIICHIN